MEQHAILDILQPFGDKISSETIELFNEFENGTTIEARFVRAIDKLDMLVTATEYEKAGFAGLSDFWNNESTFKVFEEFAEISEYAQYLKSTRNKRIAGQHDKSN